MIQWWIGSCFQTSSIVCSGCCTVKRVSVSSKSDQNSGVITGNNSPVGALEDVFEELFFNCIVITVGQSGYTVIKNVPLVFIGAEGYLVNAGRF